MPGKAIGHYSRIYTGGYDASADGRHYRAGQTYKEVDATDLSANIQWKLPDIPETSADIALWFDNATSGAHTVLQTAGVGRVITIAMGERAAPVAGDAVFATALQHKSYAAEVEVAGGVGIATQFHGWPLAFGYAGALWDEPIWDEFIWDGDDGAPAISHVWGRLLHADATEAATANGTILDNGAASANGALGILHILSSGGLWNVIIQHDTASNMATAATLMEFGGEGAQIQGEVQIASGTVNRYVRVRAVRTSGSLRFVAAIVRG